MSNSSGLSIFECKFSLDYFMALYIGMSKEERGSDYGKEVYSNIRYLDRVYKSYCMELENMYSKSRVGSYRCDSPIFSEKKTQRQIDMERCARKICKGFSKSFRSQKKVKQWQE